MDRSALLSHGKGDLGSGKDEVVPRVEDVFLWLMGVFDGALGGDGDDDFAIGDLEAIDSEEEEEEYDEDDEEK
ncbi:hypothetical protein Tco_0598476 [Tanacetum coccineum]